MRFFQSLVVLSTVATVALALPQPKVENRAVTRGTTRGTTKATTPTSSQKGGASSSQRSSSKASLSPKSSTSSSAKSGSSSASAPSSSGSSGLSSASGSASSGSASSAASSGSASGSASSSSPSASACVAKPKRRGTDGDDPGNCSPGSVSTANNAPWALARIAQKAKLSTIGEDVVPAPDGPDYGEIPKRVTTQDWKFPHDPNWGEGVLVYVVDSGVRKTHEEFGGRVEDGFVIPRIKDGKKATDDVCEHGTAVAALVAGNTVGVARKATIVPVRIADADSCTTVSTTTTDVIAGVNWAVEDYKKRNPKPKGAIINISWQVYQGTDTKSEDAFSQAIAAGLHIVVTAGNDNQNQCFNEGPKKDKWRVKDVGQVIVGATGWNDDRFDFLDEELGSNFGKCVTLFAPGVSMVVPQGKCDEGKNCDKAYNNGGFGLSGTSFSTPLVSGVLASMISSGGNKPPADMKTLLVSNALSPAHIKDPQGSPDKLLQSLILSDTNQ